MYNCFSWHAIKLCAISFVAFVAANYIWFNYFMKDKMMMGNMGDGMMMLSGYYLAAALVASFLIVKGIVIFVLPHTGGDYTRALIKGGIYGLIVYGSHELMNYAFMRDYPTDMMTYCIIWGVVLCAGITLFTVYVAEWCGCEDMCGCED